MKVSSIDCFTTLLVKIKVSQNIHNFPHNLSTHPRPCPSVERVSSSRFSHTSWCDGDWRKTFPPYRAMLVGLGGERNLPLHPTGTEMRTRKMLNIKLPINQSQSWMLLLSFPRKKNEAFYLFIIFTRIRRIEMCNHKMYCAHQWNEWFVLIILDENSPQDPRHPWNT